MMRACTLLLALASARAQTDNMQDPMITTSNGSIVISADDIQFTTPNQSTSINGLVRDVAQTFSSIRGEIARVNVSLTSRIDAALGPILTRLEDAETAAANPRLPVVTTFADLPACNPAGVGVMTHLSEADGCKSVYVCLSDGLRQRTSYAGPVAGAARCNPAVDCRAAIASAQGRPRQIYQGGALAKRAEWDAITGAEWDSTTSVAGTFFLGVAGGGVRQARCEDNGLEAGDGSASSPGFSCESIYTHHPTQKARGPQVYKMFSPEGHGQFTGFPRTISPSTGTSERQTITCSGTRNATHTIGIMYGKPTGSDRRYNYYMLPESTNQVSCTNSRFGDPQSGGGKYCYCGWYVRGTVDVKCNPTIDPRVSLTGLVGWWRAENYQLALTSAEWPSLNPAVMFGTGPAITNRVAQIENPQGWSREARYETADNNAHAQYNGLVGRSDPRSDLEATPGFFPNPAGTPGTGVNFGPLTTNYAICTTSRYMNSAANDRNSRGRIFVANTGNWLHGHYSNKANVVHYGGWASSSRGRGWRYDWIVTCTTHGGANSRNFLYSYGGVSILTDSRKIASGAGKQFGIGIGDYRTSQASVYAFGEVLIYNVAKSAADLRELALYLTDRLNGRQ